MTQLLSPVHSRQTGRISQLLPTVKCSNCNNEVGLDELGEHVCPRAPPVPSLPKPTTSPTSAAALLPIRLQNRVPNPNSRGQHTANPSSFSTQGAPQPRPGNSPLPRPVGSGLNPRRNADQRLPSPLSTGYTRSSADSWHETEPPAPVRAQRDPYPQSPVSPQARTPVPEPDTKTGGEAGMAGVGRRGFAAAARAAMLATNAVDTMSSYSGPRAISTIPERNEGMSRRGTPRLDLDATFRSPSRGATTPSLSSGNSSNSQSPPFPHSPSDARGDISPSSVSPPSTGRSTYFNRYKDDSPVAKIPSYAENSIGGGPYGAQANTKPIQSPPSSGSAYTASPDPVIASFADQSEPLELSSGSEYGGLAYADSTDTESEADIGKQPESSTASARTPRTSHERKLTTSRTIQNLKDNDMSATRAPRKKSLGSSSSSESPVHIRSASIGTSESASNYSHNTTLHQTLDARFEDDGAPSSHRSRSRLPTSLNQDKMSGPVRSRTSPSPIASRRAPIESFGPGSPSRLSKTEKEKERVGRKSEKKKKVCVRCERKIENGKWVQMDGGTILCEWCWKNMYLPKCRSCDLPIEKAAVSSSDGQLKGKYHKECFNCNTCHKPFPDKTFYVFDGKPLCAYHYHEANDSLCAAATCGQPIEGPCAVSHVGDRYHPEHMLCEHPGYPRCKERLSGDYYEVDGRMLCERHANGGRYDGQSQSQSQRWKSGESTKRTTRMITLGRNGIR